MAANNNVCIMFKNFDPKEVNFDVVGKNKMGGKFVRITYGPQKLPLRIQTPELYIPFGLNNYTDDKNSDEVNLSVDAAMKGWDSDANMQRFMQTLSAIDDLILSHCVKHSTELFGKAMTKEVVVEFYRTLIKMPKQENYSPTIRIKIPNNDAHIFNRNGEPAPVDGFVKKSSAKFILSFSQIWFVNKTFGVSARLYQAKITDTPVSGNCCIVEDDDEELA